MDRRTALRADHAASRGRNGGSFHIEMGQKTAVHGGRVCRCRIVSATTWLDFGGRGIVRTRGGRGTLPKIVSKRGIVNIGFQRKSATIVVAVLAIYAVDFSINAGMGNSQGVLRR